MIQRIVRKYPPRIFLVGIFVIFLLPFLMVMFFPSKLDRMMDIGSYVAFHNTAEFFSIMVSLCVFSVGWFTYDQSRDRHALFLGTAFLAVGLIDFMHTLSNAAMPDFLTPNSTNKSTQFWIAARLLDASAFLTSAFIYPKTQNRLLSKRFLMAMALALTGVLFIGIVFFPSLLPATAIQGVGLTAFKRYAEYLVIVLLVAAWVAYWKRMARTGARVLVHYLAAFILCIFSEAVFASYKTGFDTYNVLGHIYKIVAFCLIYEGIFVTAVKNPYTKLRTYAERLEQSNRDLLDFTFVAAHDLQEPLRKIQTFSDRIKTIECDRISDKGRDYLERMGRSAGRLQDFVIDLRKYSGAQTGSTPACQVDLEECVAEAVSDLEGLCLKTGAVIEIGELPRITADRLQMRELFQNLIGNALKYQGQETPQIKVFSNSTCPDGYIEICVKDNGLGFDECYLDKIFKPFQRLYGRNSPYAGTGMGLAICRKIVERHGGSISAMSEPGQGATFIIKLPGTHMESEGVF